LVNIDYSDQTKLSSAVRLKKKEFKIVIQTGANLQHIWKTTKTSFSIILS
jgi:hypothetical protein